MASLVFLCRDPNRVNDELVKRLADKLPAIIAETCWKEDTLNTVNVRVVDLADTELIEIIICLEEAPFFEAFPRSRMSYLCTRINNEFPEDQRVRFRVQALKLFATANFETIGE